MENRDQSGKFMPGTHGGPGRPRGKSVESRLREAMPAAVRNLCDAAEDGDIDASVALVSKFGNNL